MPEVEEAQKCKEIAVTAWQQGDIEKAIRFLEKSLHFNDGDDNVRRLLEHIRAGGKAPSTKLPPHGGGGGGGGKAPSTKLPPPGGSANNKAYTKSQEQLCKKVLMAKDFYGVLDVPKTVTTDEVKKAYRKLALQLHPDKNGAPDAEEAFKRVSKAFQMLSDPTKRNQYDQTGNEEEGVIRRNNETNGGEEFMTPEELFRVFFGFGPNARVYTTGFGHPAGHLFRQHQAHHNLTE